MASTVSNSTSQPYKAESFLDYLGTIGRKKKLKDVKEGKSISICFDLMLRFIVTTFVVYSVEDLEVEGKIAIDGPTISPATESLPEEYILSM